MGRLSTILTTIATMLWVFCAQIWATPSETQIEARWHNGAREMISRTVDPAVPNQDFQPTFHWNGGRNPFDATGSLLWQTSDPAGMMNNLAISDDGSIAAIFVDLNNMRLQVYNGQSGALVYEVPGGTEMWGNVAVAGNGDYVVYCTGTSLSLLPPDDSTPIWTSDPGPGAAIVKVAASHDGQHIFAMEGVTTLDQDSVRLWAFTPDTNIPVWTLALDYDTKGEFYGATFSADGSRVVITQRQWLTVLDPANGNVIWEGPAFNTQYAAGISGDGRVVTCGSNNDGKIRVYHWDEPQQTYILLWSYTFTGGSSNWGTATAVSANGETVAGGSLQFIGAGYEGYVAVFNTYSDGTPLWTPQPMGDLVSDVNISDDGLTIAACSWGPLYGSGLQDPSIQVYDKFASTPFFTYDVGIGDTIFSANDLAISPDGTRLFVGGKNAPNRWFGNGGWGHMFALDLEGGTVSGTVTLQGTGDYSDVTVETASGVRHTITNASGTYSLEHIPAGTHTIVAHKLGYTTGQAAGIVVTDGSVTPNINFALDTSDVAPTGLTATQNIADHIQLNWAPATLAGFRERERDRLVAAGDEPFINPRGPVALNAGIQREEYDFSRDWRRNPLDDPDSIHVWRSRLAGGPYSVVASLAGNVATYSDDLFGLRPGVNYYYVVTAVYSNGESEYSNEAVGVLNDDYLNWNPVVPGTGVAVTFDGVISAGEWSDAIQLDISDVFGYDGQDPPGTAFLYMKYDDVSDMLLVAAEDHLNPALDASEGIGFYVDDNNSDAWDYDDPGSEGNYWAYWFAGGPTLRYRSLTGGSWGVDPYYVFTDPQLGFSTTAGYLTMEVAIPMGFHQGYEIALYGPDRTPGIGAFIIERINGNPIFHGYWPQDMPSIVSNPDYFATTQINAELFVPPLPPSNILAQREGTAIHLVWTDPTMGIDSLPLNTPLDGLNLYRNNEFIDVFAPGVESYVDNDVAFGGWYEYQLEGFIPEGPEIFAGPRSAAIGIFAGAEPVLIDLAYDDGNPEVFQIPAYPYDGNREAVRFEMPPGANRVYTASIYCNTNGLAGLGVAANDAGDGTPGTQLAGPYWFQTPAVLQYVTFHIPGTDPPEIEGDSFFVTMDWQADDVWNPGLGADQTAPIDHSSFYYTNATGWQAMPVQDWMIRTSVGDRPDAADPLPPGVVHQFRLMSNYPNPFNPETTIPFELAVNGEASLKIFNLLGQEVATLISGPQVAGYHVVPWTGKNDQGLSVPSGVYIVRLESNQQMASRKIALIR